MFAFARRALGRAAAGEDWKGSEDGVAGVSLCGAGGGRGHLFYSKLRPLERTAPAVGVLVYIKQEERAGLTNLIVYLYIYCG